MGRISRHLPHLIVHVDDYRLAFGTPSQKRQALAEQRKRKAKGRKQ